MTNCLFGMIVPFVFAAALLAGCGGQGVNPAWEALCEAICARAQQCVPEDGSVAQCVSECLAEIGGLPCDVNTASVGACVAGIDELSCEGLEQGELPSVCDNVCTSCAEGAGACVEGSCEAEFPCTEQGVRDAVTVTGGPHTFSCDGPTTITTEAEIVIESSVILDGEGDLTLDGNDSHRVLDLPGWTNVGGPLTVELRGMRITSGRNEESPVACGGGIRNEGALTLVDCSVSENTVGGEGRDSAYGGGICNSGALALVRSTVSGNRTEKGPSDAGGGIWSLVNTDREVTLTDSMVSGNSTVGEGGGIYIHQGEVSVTNTTVAGNQASADGGGISTRDDVILTTSTVSGNTAGILGSGLFGGPFTIVSSTIWDAGTSGATLEGGGWTVTATVLRGDCAGFGIVSGGYNIESPGDTCGFDQTGDQPGVDVERLKLGPLADNGGATMTHALETGSVAIDRIPAEDCVDAKGEPLTTDQRGVLRPQGPACDAGAFELEAASVSVTGTVIYAGSGAPAENATVSVLGTPIGTVTDATGEFTLDVPVGSVFFQISKEGTWSQIELETVLGISDFSFELVEDSLVADLEQLLMIELDETHGVVDVIFDAPSGLGGETATLSVPYDSSLAFGADEEPTLSDQLLPGGGEDLVFVGVDLTEELTVNPMGVDGVNTCALEDPATVYPVLAKHFTRVRRVRCVSVP